ncbi:sugar ABC transporter substrate-binding protein [Nocardioides sp.]|uniref:sugar ABC transporter substrate-binding protein n=1 Tax=Nocardioides sp. TaxID=35761 RepID=UPI003D0C30A1
MEAFEATVKAGFAASTAEQTYKPPTTGPKGVSGKSLFVITCPMVAEGCKRMGEATKQAAGDLGWDVTMIDGKGDPSVGSSAVEQAIAAGADGLALVAVDAVTIQGALQNAKDKGLAAVCAFCGNSDGETGLYDAIVPSVKSFEDDGYALGQALYTLTDGHVHQLMLTDPEFVDVVGRQDGNRRFIKECQQAGGDCKIVAEQQFLVSELGTNVPTKVAAAARQNPDFNILWAPYDDALVFALQGLQQAGLADGKRWGAGFDSNTPSLDRIREDTDQKASVGLPGVWVGYAMVDNLNRLFAGEQPVDQNVHTKVLVKENAPATGPWDGDIDVRPLYHELWGVN